MKKQYVCRGIFYAVGLLVLALGISLNTKTALGVSAMSLNMRLIPNPGDGIVQALSDLSGKSVGITKNVFDLCNICFTLCGSLLFAGKPIGIGLGTVLSMISVGRVIAAFNHFFRNRMLQLAGVEK